MPGCGSASDVMKTRSLLLLFLLLAIPVTHAETDPLVSLFNFQMRMAEGGNVKAMMKVGEMYENGEGTPRNYDKALEMYRRARAKGESSAEAAIRRVEAKRRRTASHTGAASRATGPASSKAGTTTPQKRSSQKKLRTESSRKAAMEKARREAAARKAAQEKARREAAARKAAKEKARREAAARKAARERARREAAARRAAQQKEQARREAAARKAEQKRARREATGTASPSAAAKAASAPEPATPAETGNDAGGDTKKFSSDPCKTRAARFLSSCKKK